MVKQKESMMHSTNSVKKSLFHDLEKKLYIIFFLYTLGGMAAYMLSDHLIYEAPEATYDDIAKADAINSAHHIQRFKLKTSDGELIAAQHLINPNAKYTVLYSHGNSEDLGMVGPMVQSLYDQGLSVMAYDYRGYGTSEGVSSEGNTYRDINAAYQYLTQEQKIPSSQIILLGRSLGSGPTTELASKHPVGGVILDSPYLSMFKIKTIIHLYPVDRFENDQKITKIKAPLLVLHGMRDKVVPFWHGKGLYEIANSPKYALWFEGGSHSNLFRTEKDAYFGAISEFVGTLESHQQNLGKNSSNPISKISFAKVINP